MEKDVKAHHRPESVLDGRPGLHGLFEPREEVVHHAGEDIGQDLLLGWEVVLELAASTRTIRASARIGVPW